MQRTFKLAAAFGFAVLLGSAVAAHAADSTFERTLTVKGKVDLSVSTGSGTIHLKRGPVGSVHIMGRIRPSWGASDERVRQLAANPPSSRPATSSASASSTRTCATSASTTTSRPRKTPRSTPPPVPVRFWTTASASMPSSAPDRAPSTPTASKAASPSKPAPAASSPTRKAPAM